MKRMQKTRKRMLLALSLAVLVSGVALFTSGSPADARPGPVGGPLCGYTTIWDCTLPDGSVQQIIGTQCDILRFERLTGATCVIHTF